MPQPFGIGDVVGGRYRISHHVVTSADQDIVFQATDQVLGRQVSVLLASRANAKQVATSAKELAAGARSSEVEVLDLGLAEDRTFLISSLVDPNQLLDLVVPDTVPYVEPYYTDSLGSELFGQSREIAPQTYDDDAEYYARLQGGMGAGDAQQRRRSRRPGFLDKVTPGHRRPGATPVPEYSREELESELESAGDAHGLAVSQEVLRVSFSLRSDLDLVEASPAADSSADVIEATRAAPAAISPGPAGSAPTQPDPLRSNEEQASHSREGENSGAALREGPFVESAPSVPITTLAPRPSSQTQESLGVSDLQAEGEVVVEDPPAEPDTTYDRPATLESSAPQAAGYPEAPPPEFTDPPASAAAFQEPASFTGLISAVPSRDPAPFPGADEPDKSPRAASEAGRQSKVPLNGWIAAGTLAVLILAAAVLVFLLLTG